MLRMDVACFRRSNEVTNEYGTFYDIYLYQIKSLFKN